MIKCLSPHKASGSNGILNIVLMQSTDEIINHLYYIFYAVIEHGFYHKQWQVCTTLVLCKPGYPAYDIAKSYSSIELLNTIEKVYLLS